MELESVKFMSIVLCKRLFEISVTLTCVDEVDWIACVLCMQTIS